MANEVTFSPAEFEQLSLDAIIYAPLAATIKAHVQAAKTTLDFIQAVNNMPDQTFKQSTVNPDGTTSAKQITVPTLAVVKVPNLNFDSLSIDFEYSISQVYKDTNSKNFALGGDVGGAIGPVKFGLKGSFSSSRSTENTINKSGSLSVKLHASESELPEGLSKVLNWLVQGIDQQTVTPAPVAPAGG